MAIGTITVVEKARAPGPIRHDVVSFAGDGSYPTGGTADFFKGVQAALGIKGYTLLAVVPVKAGGYHVEYDSSADKLLVNYSDLNGASDGPDIEVPNATNLSGVTFKVMCISH